MNRITASCFILIRVKFYQCINEIFINKKNNYFIQMQFLFLSNCLLSSFEARNVNFLNTKKSRFIYPNSVYSSLHNLSLTNSVSSFFFQLHVHPNGA